MVKKKKKPNKVSLLTSRAIKIQELARQGKVTWKEATEAKKIHANLINELNKIYHQIEQMNETFIWFIEKSSK